jgi:FkbM family methyltransferase
MAERAPAALAPEAEPAPETRPRPKARQPEPAPIEPPTPQPIVDAMAESAPPKRPPTPQPAPPLARRRWLKAAPDALRRYLLAPVVNRIDDWRAASERRLDQFAGAQDRRIDLLTDTLLRREDQLQDLLLRRLDALEGRFDSAEARHRDLLADIERRHAVLLALAKDDLAAGREVARRLEDFDAELGRLRRDAEVLRERTGQLLGIVGPRFDELEIKVRPLVPFDDESWAVRLADGYVLVPRGQPEFAVQVANAPSGGLEAGTRRVLQALAQPGMTVADVGANVGLLTLALARAVGSQGRVHAFEPEPGPRAQLEKMAHLNGLSWTEVHPEAAGRAAGRLALHLSPIIGHSSLYELPPEEAPGARTLDVSVVTLDAAVAQPLDLAKIDVEGAELDVLAGMGRHLAPGRDIALVAEFGPAHLARTGVAPEAWWQSFKDHGFAAYAIEEPTGVCAPAALRSLMKTDSTNLVFVRRGGAAERRLPGR